MTTSDLNSQVGAVEGGKARPVHVTNGLDQPIEISGTSTKAATTVNTPAINNSGTALSANSNRRLWSIQNLGTNPLYVRLGAGASTTVFHVALKASTVQDDGSGGYIVDEMWKGAVSVAGTSPRYTVTEMQ